VIRRRRGFTKVVRTTDDGPHRCAPYFFTKSVRPGPAGLLQNLREDTAVANGVVTSVDPARHPGTQTLVCQGKGFLTHGRPAQPA